MSILPADWQELQPLLDQLLDADPGERASLLIALANGDVARRAALARLLAECERAMPLLDGEALGTFDRLVTHESEMALPDVLGGRYRITRELGHGGMARVYLAEDLKHARNVAVKVIRPELAAALGRDRFLGEIGIAARLRHPNIMPLFDSGDADGRLYFVMPYEEGPSLRRRLASSEQFSVAEALTVLRDLARALAYAHDQGVVHRDVKPDNIMLSGGAAVVADFGIARAVSAARSIVGAAGLAQAGVSMGTPAYMAPEQAVGDPAMDHRVDIYSFGCVAYEVFVGTPPFVGPTSHAVIAAHMKDTPPTISAARTDVPKAISALIARCLEKDPASRPQHAVELLDGLAVSPTARASVSPPLRARSGRRRPAIVAGSVIALIALVAIVRASEMTAPPARSLVVLPMDNQTGDAKVGYVATGLAEDIAKRIEGIGGIKVRSGARSEWPTATRHDLEMVASQLGSTYLLKTVLDKRGDSLEVGALVVDVATTAEKSIAKRRFSTEELRDVESDMAARIAAAIFGVAIPADPHPAQKPPAPESYRLMLEGWHALLTLRQPAAARALFQAAVDSDATNARAWSGLSSAWANQATAEAVPYAEGYEQAELDARHALALDSAQGTAWANLGFLRANRYRSLETGLALIGSGKERDPGNPEVFLLEAALYRSAWRWDKSRESMRIARRLDPISPFYVNIEAVNEMCAGQFAVALKLYDGMLARVPSDSVAVQGKRRSLAALGRFDDAITVWKQGADPVLADRLSRARGAAGYWDVQHLAGQQRLQRLKARAARGAYLSPRVMMLAKFAAGDIEAGFGDLEQLADVDVPMYRLPCMPDLDEVRAMPRFLAIQTRVGALPR
jgi:serine/threonine-protein kinase